MFVHLRIACSQTLSFLFKVRRAQVIKNKNREEFVDRQRKGVGVGEEQVFENNEKKNKTTSVYRLIFTEFVLCKGLWIPES